MFYDEIKDHTHCDSSPTHIMEEAAQIKQQEDLPIKNIKEHHHNLANLASKDIILNFNTLYSLNMHP